MSTATEETNRNSETTVTPDETAAGTAPATPTPAAPESEPEPGTNREARYRKQLRETETERDTLRERVAAFQRSEAERLSNLEKPAALWATGLEVSEVLTEDGQIDPAKVAAAAQLAHEQLGASRPVRVPSANPAQGASAVVPVDNWKAAFKG
jgi:hypothetical protein